MTEAQEKFDNLPTAKEAGFKRWETDHPENDILPAVASPNEIMMEAVRKGMGKDQLEVLERMFEFDLKVKQQQAKEAYFKAKSAFKKEDFKVIRDKMNKQYESKYASEDSLLNTVNPILSKHGLEASFDFPKVEGGLAVTCILTHELGHSQEVTLLGPPDTSGSKNPLQQIKSTVTYLRKATFEAVTGIATTDKGSDDDGNSAGSPVEYITDQQFADIQSLIAEVDANEKAFCKYMKIESVDKMPSTMYETAIKKLEQKRDSN